MKGLTYCQSISATRASKKMTNTTSGMAVRDESWSCFHPRRGIPDRRMRGTSCVDAVSVGKRKRNPPVHHESCIFVWKWCPDRNEKYIHICPLLFQTLLSLPTVSSSAHISPHSPRFIHLYTSAFPSTSVSPCHWLPCSFMPSFADQTQDLNSWEWKEHIANTEERGADKERKGLELCLEGGKK